MLKMLPHALVAAGIFTLSLSAVLAGESYVACLGDDTEKITYPENAKHFKCGTQVRDTARAQMFENITVIGSPLVLSTPAEVDAAEAHLGIRFPTGYREYVTKFGEGVLGGNSWVTCDSNGLSKIATGAFQQEVVSPFVSDTESRQHMNG